VARIAEVLVLSQRSRRELRDDLRCKAAALDQVLSHKVTFHECADALRRGFSTALNLSLQPGELLPDERVAMALLREKHLKREWLFDRVTRTRSQDG
jgi:hypothetical protein